MQIRSKVPLQVRQNAKLIVTAAAFASASIDWAEAVVVSAARQISVYYSETASYITFESPAEGEVRSRPHVHCSNRVGLCRCCFMKTCPLAASGDSQGCMPCCISIPVVELSCCMYRTKSVCVVLRGELVVAPGQRCSVRVNGRLLWHSAGTWSAPQRENFSFEFESMQPLPGRQHVRMLCYVHGTDVIYEPVGILTFTIVDRAVGKGGASGVTVELGRAASVTGGPVFAMSEDCAKLATGGVTSQGYAVRLRLLHARTSTGQTRYMLAHPRGRQQV